MKRTNYIKTTVAKYDRNKASSYYRDIKGFKKVLKKIKHKNKVLWDKVSDTIKQLRQQYNSTTSIPTAVIVGTKTKGYRIERNDRVSSYNSREEYCAELHNRTWRLYRNIKSLVHEYRTQTRNKHLNEKILKSGERIKLCGRTHIESHTILDLLKKKKVQDVFVPKGPKSEVNHIGVEIEFASFLHHDDIAAMFHDCGLTPYIQLQHEYIQGRHNGEFEYELTIVAPETEIKAIVQKICDILNERVDANVTFGCGLHVHVDVRNRDITKVFNNFFNSQHLLYSMVAYSRRDNKFCKVMDKKIWQPTTTSCSCATDPCRHSGSKKADRYFGLNTWSYAKHRTFEIRIHSGTSSALKINNWIDVLISIADGKHINKPLKSLEELEKYVPLDLKIKDYMKSRIKAFAEKNNKDYDRERESLRARTRPDH